MWKWIHSLVCLAFFVSAFVLLVCAFSEKFAGLFGLEILRGYPPSRLLGLSVVAVLFVIALELRETKTFLNPRAFEEEDTVLSPAMRWVTLITGSVAFLTLLAVFGFYSFS